MNVTLNLMGFDEARKTGEIVDKSGYHQPDTGRTMMQSCGCEKTTEKGAYRDVTVEFGDGSRIHFYHQTPVVVEFDGHYKLNSGGYQTSTTKERINRHIPSGYYVRQRDFVWYLETPEGEVEFEDSMTFEVQG